MSYSAYVSVISHRWILVSVFTVLVKLVDISYVSIQFVGAHFLQCMY